jgi:DnaK suppressor protein
MSFYDSSMAARFERLLAAREAELKALLEAAGDGSADVAERGGEVTDFKDLAQAESRAALDDAQAAHAALELPLLGSARRRIAGGTYGQCLDCGEPIDLRRLEALPMAPYCTACQAIHEHDVATGPGHPVLHVTPR